MKKLFTVSADHVSPRYALQGVTVECRTNDDGETWYAILPGFGCGLSLRTPRAAIRDLLMTNGCTNIRVAEMALELDAFRATRVETANQFIYDEGLYIDKSRDGRTYSLIISNQEWSGVATADYLARLESVLYHMHYLPECHGDMMLSSDAKGVANLDSYIRGLCDANGYECDGDAFGVMFSEKDEWRTAEAFQQALATVRTYKLSPSARHAAWFDDTRKRWLSTVSGKTLAAMGFDLVHTGGGCTALDSDAENEWHLRVTDSEGLGHYLDETGNDHWLVGAHHVDGQMYSDECTEARTFTELLDAIKAHRLALRFAAFVRHDIGEERFPEMRDTNARVYGDKGDVCATHDYCDANMPMLAAWRDVFKRSPDMTADADLALWNRAWTIAKADYLSGTPNNVPAIEYAESLLSDGWTPVLNVGDGTLDEFIRQECARLGARCDGDVFGMMFSESDDFTREKAARIVAEAVRIYGLDKPEEVAAEAVQIGTVDISPTWESILPALMVALVDGTEEGKRLARIELQRMAKVADMAKGAALDAQELATVLAALRFYQESGMGEPGNRSNAIHEIATNGDSVVSLDADAIDALCERLNVESYDGK